MGGEEYDHLYKIILVGDAAVGKTHLVWRYIRGVLPRNPKATIGVEFATRTVPLVVGGTVKAQIWDTAGQERYRSITSAHYRRAAGALLVYDVTNKASFINASKWLEELRHNAEPDIVVMIVGNKLDLVLQNPSTRSVSFEMAAQYAHANDLFFSETSAVSNLNVKHIFEHLLQEIYNQKSRIPYLPLTSNSSVEATTSTSPRTAKSAMNPTLGKLSAYDSSASANGLSSVEGIHSTSQLQSPSLFGGIQLSNSLSNAQRQQNLSNSFVSCCQ